MRSASFSICLSSLEASGVYVFVRFHDACTTVCACFVFYERASRLHRFEVGPKSLRNDRPSSRPLSVQVDSQHLSKPREVRVNFKSKTPE